MLLSLLETKVLETKIPGNESSRVWKFHNSVTEMRLTHWEVLFINFTLHIRFTSNYGQN